MLTIRLQRTGKKNQADFRIVLAEKESPVQKKFTEVLGTYNPRKKAFNVKKERVEYWLGQHVAMSPTVNNLFVTHGVMNGPKVKAFSVPKKAEEKPAESTPTPPSATADTSPQGEEEVPAAPVGAPAESAPAAEQPAA